jgi:hypothetical protein
MWHMAVIPALGRLRASLGFRENLSQEGGRERERERERRRREGYFNGITIKISAFIQKLTSE